LTNLKTAKATDVQGLAAYLSAHPGLEQGLDLLANLYVSELPTDILNEGSTITVDYLRSCIDEACSGLADEALEPIKSVLESLVDLSNKLEEDLFVSTVKTA